MQVHGELHRSFASLKMTTHNHQFRSNEVFAPQLSQSLESRIFFAASSSFRFSGSTLGYDKSRDSRVSTNTMDTTSLVNHLLSAGTTYHGASSVAVLRIMAS